MRVMRPGWILILLQTVKLGIYKGYRTERFSVYLKVSEVKGK